MDDNIYKKVKDKLLNGIEISENDLRYIKLNANRFKNIKFIKKRKAKRNGLHRNRQNKQKNKTILCNE